MSLVLALAVRLSFDKPTATFLSALTMPYAGVMSPSAVRAAGDQVGSNPATIGVTDEESDT